MKLMHLSKLRYHPCFDGLIAEQRKNHKVVFVKFDLSENDPGCKIIENSVWFVRLAGVKNSFDFSPDIKLRKALHSLFIKHKPDLIHIQLLSGMNLLTILNAASSFGIKKVVTLHDHSLFCLKGIYHDGKSKCLVKSVKDCVCEECEKFAFNNNESLKIYNRLREERAKKIIAQADKIICPSHHQRKQLYRFFGNNPKFVTLPYGVGLPSYVFKAHTGSKPVFGYLGTLAWMKGIPLIENAAKRLETKDFKILMGLTCDPNNKLDNEHLKRLRKSKKIKILRNVTRNNLYRKFFSKISYLIIPSLWEETGPMTLLEAFFYRVPVIISDNESIKEKIVKNRDSMIFKDGRSLETIMKGIINGTIRRSQDDIFEVSGIKQYSRDVEYIYKETLKTKTRALFLKLGYTCNNNCIFCVTGNNTPKEFVDGKAVLKTLMQNRNRYGEIILTGGEPTLHGDFLKILEFAYMLGYQILLQTNARMFSDISFCEKVKNYNLRFMININSSDAGIHDLTTGVQGSFSQTVAGVKNLNKYGFKIIVKVMLAKLNYKRLLETVKFIKGLGIKEVWLVFLTPYGRAEDNFKKVVPRYSSVLPYVKCSILWLKKNKGVKISLEGFPYCLLMPEFRTMVTEENLSSDSLDGLYPGENSSTYNCKYERQFKQKQKFPLCLECAYNDKCEGIYRTYAKYFGNKEFKPLN